MSILSMIKPKPESIKRSCPFCGSDMKIYKSYTIMGGYPYYISCSGDRCCPITPRTANCPTEEIAWEVWDNCTSKHDKKIDQLKESLEHSNNTKVGTFEFLELNHKEVYNDVIKYFYNKLKDEKHETEKC